MNENGVVPSYLLIGGALQPDPAPHAARAAGGGLIGHAMTGNLQTVTQQKALTYDDGKAPLASLPWAGLDSMAKVQAYGHKKYGDFYNYRKGMEVSRNLSCAIRHIRDFMDGADLDPESGESHLGHAMTRLGYVLQNMKDGTVIDDRYSKRNSSLARPQQSQGSP